MNSTNIIGQRLRQRRDELGWSREKLSARSRDESPAGHGISADAIKKIELGDVQAPGIGTITILAAAMRVDMSWLLDRRPRLRSDNHGRGVLAVRDALTDPADLPGINLDEDGPPASLEDLEAAVGTGWDAYWAGRFTALTTLLPPLIRAARASRPALGTAGSRALAQAFQLTADWCVHMGYDHLAHGACRSAIRAAATGDDELQQAVLSCTLSWTLLHEGRLDRAEQVAAVAAEAIRPQGKAPLAARAVYGALLLSAAAPAATAGNAGAVAGYMEEARVQAMYFTEGDSHEYAVSMGPTQVAMQQAYTSQVLHRYGDALAAAGRVNPDDLLRISWGAHQLDVALACLGMGGRRRADGIEALCEAQAVSREWAAQQPQFRDAVGAVLTEQKRRSDIVQTLAETAGLR